LQPVDGFFHRFAGRQHEPHNSRPAKHLNDLLKRRRTGGTSSGNLFNSRFR
jgi:hypothetical protein